MMMDIYKGTINMHSLMLAALWSSVIRSICFLHRRTPFQTWIQLIELQNIKRRNVRRGNKGIKMRGGGLGRGNLRKERKERRLLQCNNSLERCCFKVTTVATNGATN